MFLKAGAHKFKLVDFLYDKLVMDNWMVKSNGDKYRPLLSECMYSQIIVVNAEFWVLNFSRSNLMVSFRRLIQVKTGFKLLLWVENPIHIACLLSLPVVGRMCGFIYLE